MLDCSSRIVIDHPQSNADSLILHLISYHLIHSRRVPYHVRLASDHRTSFTSPFPTMSGLIDYSSRARGTRRTPPSSTADDNTTSEPVERLRSEEDPFSDRSGTSVAYADNAQHSQVTAPTSTTQSGGRGTDSIDVERARNAGQDDEYNAAVLNDYRGEDGAFFDPTFPSYEEEGPLEMPFFDHIVRDYGEMGLFGKGRLLFRQTLSFFLSLAGLGAVLVLAFVKYFNPFKKSPRPIKADREYERRITGERLSGRPEYYAEYWGYHCDVHEIVTEGGWILKAHRISDPRRPGPPGHPVILQHGILCNSSHFFMCEERSMAFWLVNQGYDVWATNIRANFRCGHTEYTRFDPRFWSWGLKELAYDLRDVIEFICGATGKPRVAFVGHSQGSGSMYLALSPGICPQLGRRLSCFVALGPSVYAGPVLRKFPFSLLRTFRSRKWWSLVFGIKEFIPAIALFQRYLPAFWFGHLGAVLIGYLFGLHRHNWNRRQVPKIFRSVPVPTSSELLYWYMASFSHRGCIFDPRMSQPWFPKTFPPHSVVGGSIDMLVLTRPLLQRLERNEPNVRMVHALEVESYEHLDMIFSIDAHKICYPVIKDTIESTLHETERPQEMYEGRA